MSGKNNATISLCVDKVLDHVGASEQIRWNQVEKGLTDVVVLTLSMSMLHNHNFRCHKFGSWCEGTTIKGLASDIDNVVYDMDYPAFERIPSGLVFCHLIINDGTTKPGYVKLQVVYNGIPLTSNIVASNTDSDQLGRFCLSRDNGPWKNSFDMSMPGLRHERTGPAFTLFGTDNMPNVDHVWALRCYSVPSFTSDWIHRTRKYDWPSQQQLDNMSNYGCFLVGKGHPSSQTEHIEWRISFSFQERELMFNLNSTQHKCYIVLKMIKQCLVSKINEKSISSYHLKTALFYTIENTPTHIWIPHKLVYCTELCLKQLLDWLNNENCPNFFVPEENMFDRLSSDVMKMTATLVRDMLDSDGQYLMLLTCDKFGELLQESLSGKVLSCVSSDAIEFDLYRRMISVTYANYWTSRIVTLPNRSCASETLSALQSLLEQLRQSEERLASEKVFREIKQGIGLILPKIHLQIAQTIAAIMLTVTDTNKTHELMEYFDHHIEQANGCDIMSQRLIKASLLFEENKLEECEKILVHCETSLKDSTLPTCSCTGTLFDDHLKKMTEKVNTTCLSLLELGNKYATSCLKFLPSQADLVPTPLHYEMYRSVGADTDTLHLAGHYWYGAIAIDAKVYLFFLQYLVYSKLSNHDLAKRAKFKLLLFLREATITPNYNIGHMEMGLNLSAWILKTKQNSPHNVCTSLGRSDQIIMQLNGTCL